MDETPSFPVFLDTTMPQPAPPERRPLRIASILFLFFLVIFLPLVNFPPFIDWLMYKTTGVHLPPGFEKDVGENRMLTYVATIIFQCRQLFGESKTTLPRFYRICDLFRPKQEPENSGLWKQ